MNHVYDVKERLKRLDRSLKYCVFCGNRLKEGSYNDIHKSCINKTKRVHKKIIFNNDTGEKNQE